MTFSNLFTEAASATTTTNTTLLMHQYHIGVVVVVDCFVYRFYYWNICRLFVEFRSWWWSVDAAYKNFFGVYFDLAPYLFTVATEESFCLWLFKNFKG